MGNIKTLATLIFTICFMQIADKVFAHERIDSLRQKLTNVSDDSTRLDILNEIACELKESDPVRAIELIDSVIQVSKTQNNHTCLANAYNQMGMIYTNLGDFKNALEWILKSNDVSHKSGDSIGIAKALNSMGLVYKNQHSLDKSLEYFGLAIGIYQRLYQFDALIETYDNIGLIYKERGNYKEALTSFKQSIIYLDSAPNQLLAIRTRLNLAETYLEMDKLQEALSEIKDCEDLYKKSGTKLAPCELYLVKGKYFSRNRNDKLSEEFFLKAIATCEKVNNYKIKRDALYELVGFYQKKKNYSKAYEYLSRYHALIDSLNSINNKLLLLRLDVQSENDEKLNNQNKISEIKDQIQTAEIEYQKRIRNFLIIGLFIILILGLVSVLNYRQKLKNIRIMNSQRKEILLKTEILREQMEEDREKTELIEFINEENEILSLVAKETDNTVFLINPEGNIEWVNEAFSRLSGYSFEEFKRERGASIFQASSSGSIEKHFNRCLEQKIPVSYVSKTQTKFKETIWIHTTLTPVLNDTNEVVRLIAIDADITKMKEAEEQIAVKNMEITWSLQYARKIQKAVLPAPNYIRSIFPEHFIINLPQNIVSGDFFWVADNEKQSLAVVADSTGHGVPGAFMSMLGISALQEIISKMDFMEPTIILDKLREKIMDMLHYEDSEFSASDSLDIALCVIDKESLKMSYAGSNNPVFIIRDDVLVELKPDKYFLWDTNENNFTLKTHQLLANDRVYLFTDGFSDQFGGESDKKYSRRRLKKLLLDVYTLPMETQKDLFRMELRNWQGSNEQIDDILVFAFQI